MYKSACVQRGALSCPPGELHTMSETLVAHFAKQDGSMRRVMNQVKAFSRSAERRD